MPDTTDNFFQRVIRSVRAFFSFFVPPSEWRLAVIILLGIFTGLILYTLKISNALSYLSEDPRACINCHVMTTQYATWERSAHRRAATCVDCHVPHDNIFHKYQFKAKDGMRHATIFTLRQEPQVIQIKEDGRKVVFNNCIRCHEYVLQDLSIHQQTYEDYKSGDAKLCWDCHRMTPHGRVRSLSAAPYAQVPELPDVVPPWMESLLYQDNHDEILNTEGKNETNH